VYALRNEQLTQVDELRLEAERADEAQLWLDCYLFHERQLTPTAKDVALRFGERSPTFWHSLRILQALWKQAGAEPAAQTKFAEWQSLLSIVYGSPVGDEDLFLRHTYLALFARVLAYVTLEHHAPSEEELRGIVGGETFVRMGLENFVENDFFTWADGPIAAAVARGLLRSIATRLTAAYDLGAIREDLLKELYQELVDPQTRHDLGEFYTPDWLAELTLRQAGFPPETAKDAAAASLLDPSCGSGTFLFTAVRLLREAGRKGRPLSSIARTIWPASTFIRWPSPSPRQTCCWRWARMFAATRIVVSRYQSTWPIRSRRSSRLSRKMWSMSRWTWTHSPHEPTSGRHAIYPRRFYCP
jgi:hypothetical protein